MPDGKGNLAYLYNGLKAKGLYDKSFDTFQQDYSTPKAQEYLYNGLQKKGLYDKDYSTFKSQYFAPAQAASTNTGNPSTKPENPSTNADTLKEAALQKFDTDTDKATPEQQAAIAKGKAVQRDVVMANNSTVEAFKPDENTLTNDAIRLMEKEGKPVGYYKELISKGQLNEYDRFQLESTGLEMGAKALTSQMGETAARIKDKQKGLSDQFAEAQILKAQGKTEEYNKAVADYNAKVTAFKSDPDVQRLNNLDARYKELVDYGNTMADKYPNIKKQREDQIEADVSYKLAKTQLKNGDLNGLFPAIYYQAVNPALAALSDIGENALAGVGALTVEPFVKDNMWRNYLTAFKNDNNVATPKEATGALTKDNKLNYEGILPTMLGVGLQSYGFFKGGEALGNGDLAQIASVAIQSQPDFMQAAYNNGLTGKEAAAYAWTNGLIQGLTERIMPEEKVWGTHAIARRMTPKAFAKLSGTTSEKMGKFLAEGLKIIGQEEGEELVSFVAQPVVNLGANKLMGSTFSGSDTSYDTNQLLNTIVTTAIGTLPMAVMGGAAGVNNLTKVSRYEAGLNADKYTAWIADQVSSGKMNPNKAKALTDQIAAMKQIVDRLPDTTPTGKKIGYSTKVDLASAIFEHKKAKAMAETVDESLAPAYEKAMAESENVINDFMKEQEPNDVLLNEQEQYDLEPESQSKYRELLMTLQSPKDEEERKAAEEHLKQIRTDYDTFKTEDGEGLFTIEPLRTEQPEGGVAAATTTSENKTDEKTTIQEDTTQPAGKAAEAVSVDEVAPTTKKERVIDAGENISNVVGMDAEYNGVIGTIEQDDEGNYVFDDGTKQTILPVQDKTNPRETIGDLGLTVAPEKVKKESVPVINKVGDVEYKGRKYHVLFTNDPKDVAGTKVYLYNEKGELKPVSKQSKVNDIIQQFKQENGIATEQAPLTIKSPDNGLRKTEVQTETPEGVPPATEGGGSETATVTTPDTTTTASTGTAAELDAMAHQIYNKPFAELSGEETMIVEGAVEDTHQFDENTKKLQDVDAELKASNEAIAAARATINAPKAVYLSENEAQRMFDLHKLYLNHAKLLLKKGFITTSMKFDDFKKQFPKLTDKLGKVWSNHILQTVYDTITGKIAPLTTKTDFLAHTENELKQQPAPTSTPGANNRVLTVPHKRVDSEVAKALKVEMNNIFAAFKKGVDKAASLQKKMQLTANQRENVRKSIKDFLDNQEINGQLTEGQVKKLINWATRIKTPTGLWNFYKYAIKTIEDANYDEKLDRATTARKRIKKQLKKTDKNSRPSPVNQNVLRQFLAVNPDIVDIDEYLDMAEQIVSDLKGIQAKSDALGNVNILNDQKSLTTQEVEDYTKQKMQEQEDILKRDLLEINDVMVKLGLIDNTMSPRDMQDVIDAYMGTPAANPQTALQKENELLTLQVFMESKKQDLEDYVNDPANAGLEDWEKATIAALRNVNVMDMSKRELQKLNDIMDNIINNDDFTGSGYVVAKSIAKNAIARAKNRLIGKRINDLAKRNRYSRDMSESLDNRAILLENIWLNTELTADMQDILGISELERRHTKVQNMQDKFVDGVDEIKESLPEEDQKEIDSFENRMMRGMYALVDQWYENTERGKAEAFVKHKAWVQQSIDNARTNGNNKLADAYQKVYDQVLANAYNAADVRNNIDAANSGNSKIVDYIKQQFADRVDDFERVSEVNHGDPFVRVHNYAPVFKIGHSKKEVTDVNDAEVNYLQRLFSTMLDSRGSKSRLERKKENTLDKGQVLDLDFDAAASRTYRENNYDIETTPIIQQLVEIFNDKDAGSIFGSTLNKDIVFRHMAKTIVAQKGIGGSAGEMGSLVAAADFLAKQGARKALFSVTQVAKQYVSVMANAATNLGRDMDLIPKSMKEIKLHEEGFDKLISQSATGRRGKTKAGLDKTFNVRDIQALDLDKESSSRRRMKKISKWYNDTSFEIQSKPIVLGDTQAAQHSWYAFYMQYARDHGRQPDDIDLDTEWQNPDKAAMSYAEQQVSRLQVSSDKSSQGSFFKSRDDTKRIIWSFFMPFSSFGLNQIRRTSIDLRKLQYPETRKEAAKSLSSTLIEQMFFNALKQLVIQPLAYGLANAITGGGGDDKDKNPYFTKETGFKYAANVVADFMLSGTAFALRYFIEGIINDVYKKETGSNREMYYHAKDTDNLSHLINYAGIYGIFPKEAYDAGTLMQLMDGKADRVAHGGLESRKNKIIIHPDEVKLTPKERAIVTADMAMKILSLVGVSDQFATQVMQKASGDVQKRVKSQSKKVMQFKDQ